MVLFHIHFPAPAKAPNVLFHIHFPAPEKAPIVLFHKKSPSLDSFLKTHIIGFLIDLNTLETMPNPPFIGLKKSDLTELNRLPIELNILPINMILKKPPITRPAIIKPSKSPFSIFPKKLIPPDPAPPKTENILIIPAIASYTPFPIS